MRLVHFIVCVTVALGAMVAMAGDESTTPEVTAEHASLEMWVGSWSGSGEMKPGPYGPGGEMSWTEHCTWFEGSKHHVVCRSEGDGPMGSSKGLGIIGYNPEKGKFTHYGVDSNGWSGYAEGTKDGDTWTYTSEETMGGEVYETRYTVTLESDAEVSFTWSVSGDGGETWDLLMDGTSTRTD